MYGLLRCEASILGHVGNQLQDFAEDDACRLSIGFLFATYCLNQIEDMAVMQSWQVS